MPDIIQLLPDSIANQIAAGEVIQRPASAVKELLENAVDAEASRIQLIVQDAGKSLVQVIDNGRGMSETDARMCFERHATSKIQKIEDLFHIRTMGFRGEALASIAAVAQVELKTRRPTDTAGTLIEIENSEVLRQEPVAMNPGTHIAMKNLFFNIPARRNFLKSNASEMRHLVDEFIRVALAFPGIHFSLTHNGQQLFFLEPGSLKQRVVQVLGNPYNARLVTVQEKTDYLRIYGFVGKPDTAKKTRGDQYFFVNNRFIRSAYLQHAVMSAYRELIPADSYPLYSLFIDLDPSVVDINVHPTKQEIKFEDEKIVYAFVQAAVKHALAQFSITPTLEFDLDPGIQQLDAINKPFTSEKQEAATGSALFRNFMQKNQAHFIDPAHKNELRHWKDFFESGSIQKEESKTFVSLIDHLKQESPEVFKSPQPADKEIAYTESTNREPATRTHLPVPDYTASLTQILNTYILASGPRGFLLIHQQRAHERILYERLKSAAEGQPIPIQRSLFPVTLQLSAPDCALLTELLSDLQKFGFQAEPFGPQTFVIQGTPVDIQEGFEKKAIESLLEEYKNFNNAPGFSPREKLIRSMARQQSIHAGRILTEKEMNSLITDLFLCRDISRTPNGHPVLAEFDAEYLKHLFEQK